MKSIHLQDYQVNAIVAIQEALDRGQMLMVVEMPVGVGSSVVLAKTLELLMRRNLGKILVIVGNVTFKKKIECDISNRYQDLVQLEKESIVVETETKILRHTKTTYSEYSCIIFYNTSSDKKLRERADFKRKQIVAFSTLGQSLENKDYSSKDIIFTYSLSEAVYDGILTPAMDAEVFDDAVNTFSKMLLQQFGYPVDYTACDIQIPQWTLSVRSPERNIWVECKWYKSQVLSPITANELLKSVVMKRAKEKITEADCCMLLILSKVPTFDKKTIFERYHIIVFDIENLVYYCRGNPKLLKLLSQITYPD